MRLGGLNWSESGSRHGRGSDRPRCGRRGHDPVRRPVLYDRALGGWGSWRRRLWVFHRVHGGLEDVRLNGDGDLTKLRHALLWRIVGLFDHDALPFRRLRPVLFEDTFACPFLARSQQRLGKHAAGQVSLPASINSRANSLPFCYTLVFGSGEVVGLGRVDRRQGLACCDGRGQWRGAILDWKWFRFGLGDCRRGG